MGLEGEICSKGLHTPLPLSGGRRPLLGGRNRISPAGAGVDHISPAVRWSRLPTQAAEHSTKSTIETRFSDQDFIASDHIGPN